MALSKSAKRRMIIAMADQKSGNEVIGSLGVYGGFFVNSSLAASQVSSDIAVIPSPGNLGAFRIEFPKINQQINSIDWFEVKGFTPRNPNGVEACDVLVTGYNQDATTKQWYITIQLVVKSSGSFPATVASAGFVVGVRAAFSLLPASNAL